MISYSIPKVPRLLFLSLSHSNDSLQDMSGHN